MDVKLRSLNNASSLKELQDYVQRISIDEICTELNGICLKEDGSSTLQTLLRGLSDSPKCLSKKGKIFTELLNHFNKKTIPSRLVQSLMCILISEVENLPTSYLVTFINKCLLVLQKNVEEDEEYKWWIHFMPHLLTIVSERSVVEHNGTIISGSEFKNHIVNSIILNEWSGSMIGHIASMFVDVPLHAEEHLRVTNKLCKSLKHLKPNEIPPVTHQLLQLTKDRHSIQLFTSLAEFFEENLYNCFDCLEIQSSSNYENSKGEILIRDVQAIEGTVLYHIHTAATILSPKSVRDFVKWLKESSNNPQLVLRPFFLTLLLNISRVSPSLEEEILALLSTAVSRSIAETEKLAKSMWLNSVVSSRVDVGSVFNKVIQNCSRDRDAILKGLIGLGFALLSLKCRGKESNVVWFVGTNLLIELAEKYPHVTNEIFLNLVNQISQEHDSTRHTDCLRKLVGKRPLNLLDSTATIMQLLANVCSRLSPGVGQRVIIAILPLTKLSPSFRDNFIIFLRKALFSNQSSREMAVFGFLELLKFLKIHDMRSLSQSASQNYVGITQIYSGTYDSASGIASNEGLCLEILTLLKQVFEYHLGAKIVLYKGAYNTFRANQKLGVHILENLKSRLDVFYKGEQTPPLDFDKAIIRDSSGIVKEPLANLLLGMAQIVAKTQQEYGGKNKFKELLDALREKFIETDIPHYNLEGENEGDHELEQTKIHEIMGVYEALMGYTLCTWIADSLEPARKFIDLFKGFSKLCDYAKGSVRPIKKKNDDRKASQGGQTKPIINIAKVKQKCQGSQWPATVLDLKSSSRLLAVLHGMTVDWAKKENTELLRNKKDLHRYALNVFLQLIIESRNMSQEELVGNKKVTHYVFYVAKILYLYCLRRLQEVKEFDIQCATLATECFGEILNFVHVHFNTKMSNFLKEIGVTGEDLDDQLKDVLNLIFEHVSNLLEEAEEEIGDEGRDATQHRKICVNLLSMCSLLTDYLSKDKSGDQQVFEKIQSICKAKKIPNANIAKSLMSLLLNTNTKSSIHDTLVLNLVLCLCETMKLIDDEMEMDAHENYAVINEKTATHCLLAICDDVRTFNNEIEWAVSRCKTDIMESSYFIHQSLENGKREALTEKEKKICRRLNFNIKVLSMLCTIAVPPGSLADGVLKEVANLYNKLVATTKYFLYKFVKCRETFEDSGFKKTIKMADHELAKNMYCFTEHIIADGSANEDEPPLKKHKADATALKKKVLKETKIIPKVIYEKEQFQKFVLQLSNKTKIELELKNSMARDYRLYAKQVKEIIEKENEYNEEILMNEEYNSDGEHSQSSKRMKTQE